MKSPQVYAAGSRSLQLLGFHVVPVEDMSGAALCVQHDGVFSGMKGTALQMTVFGFLMRS